MMTGWMMRKCSMIVVVALSMGLAATAQAQRDDVEDVDPGAVGKARRLLESGNTPQGIQLFVHGSGDLTRVSYDGISKNSKGFRIWYTYYWKSKLSDNNNRTVLAFDFDDSGIWLDRCLVGDDSSFLPAFSEAQLILEIAKELLRDDPELKKHPEVARAIENADARRLLVYLLRLQKLYLMLRS